MIFVETKMHAKMKRESLFYLLPTKHSYGMLFLVLVQFLASNFVFRKSEINHQKSKIFFNHIVNWHALEIIVDIETFVYIDLKRA
jgi:hypothetical protein